MSLIGAPLPSATYAGYDSSYYAARDSGGQLVGVQSLNGLIGVVAVAGDTSIGVTKPGLGVIQVSTAGLPQAPSSVTATGAITGATVTATGALSANTANINGPVSVGGALSLAAGNSLVSGPPGNTCNVRWGSQTLPSVVINQAYPIVVNGNGGRLLENCLLTVWATNSIGNFSSVSILITQITSSGLWAQRQSFQSAENGIIFSTPEQNSLTGVLATFTPTVSTGPLYISYRIESTGV